MVSLLVQETYHVKIYTSEAKINLVEQNHSKMQDEEIFSSSPLLFAMADNFSAVKPKSSAEVNACFMF